MKTLPAFTLVGAVIALAVTSAVALGFAALLASQAPGVPQPSDWFGTWRLVLERSVYATGPAPYRRATMRVEPRDGMVHFAYDFVLPRGGVQHLEWTGRFDGKDYILQGADEYVTYAYRQTADRTYEIVAKIDMRVTAVAMVTFSPDGPTLTTVTRAATASGQDITSVTVYEKSR
jgi:hypothetical protein